MDFTRLTAYLNSLRACGIPGCEMHVSLDGRQVYTHCAGFADAAGIRPASPNDTYWVFSCTKVLTAVCTMQLVEKGLIELDAPVSRYLPEYADITVRDGDDIRPARTELTVRHLMTMTGGFDYNLSAEPVAQANKDGNATTRQIVAALAKVPLQFDPGTDYCYSLCLDVLGGVIEVVSGMTLGEYMRRCIFDPLGMKDISFGDNELVGRLSDMYSYDSGLYRAIPTLNKNKDRISPYYQSGGGGIISTATEYAKFAAALANDGVSAEGYRLISRDSIDIMRTQQLTEAQQRRFINTVGKPGYGYGLGVRTLISREISAGRSPLGEFGWDGMGGCYTLMDVEHHIGIFFAMQVTGCGYCYANIHPRLRDLTYEALNK